VSYDNFEGRWGKPEELNRFLQAYAVKKATLESRKAGHSVHEKLLDDGSVKLSVMVAGGDFRSGSKLASSRATAHAHDNLFL